MAEANIVILGATLNPNPVQAGKTFILSVDIQPIKYVLDTGDGSALASSDGSALRVKE